MCGSDAGSFNQLKTSTLISQLGTADDVIPANGWSLARNEMPAFFSTSVWILDSLSNKEGKLRTVVYEDTVYFTDFMWGHLWFLIKGDKNEF